MGEELQQQPFPRCKDSLNALWQGLYYLIRLPPVMHPPVIRKFSDNRQQQEQPSAWSIS